MKNHYTQMLSLLVSALSISFVSYGATDWVGDVNGDGTLENASDWNPSNLPDNSGNVGTIGTGAGSINGSGNTDGYYIVQEGGDVSLSGGSSGNMAGGQWSISGGTLTRISGDMNHIDGYNFSVSGGVVSFTQDYFLGSATGTSTFEMSDGDLTVDLRTVIRDGSVVTISGGTLNFIDEYLTRDSGTVTNFNGGTVTIGNDLNFNSGGLVRFGGTTSGSVTASSINGGTGINIDWSMGSLMSLTVTGENETYFQNLYTGGQLLYENDNTSAFSDNFQVSGDTLSLIPEPSSIALLGLAGMALVITRYRKK